MSVDGAGAKERAKGTARPQLGLLWRLGWAAATVAASMLLALSVPRLYDFSSSDAWSMVHLDSRHYLDLVTRAPAGWPLVLGLATFLVAAAGLGRLGVRLVCPWTAGRAEVVLLSLGMGLAGYTYLFLAVGWAQLLRGPVIAGLIVVGLLAAAPPIVRTLRSRRWSRPGRPAAGSAILVIGIAFSLYVALIAALGPEVQFDARWYHLGVPVHYALNGGMYEIVRVTRLAAAGLTPYQEILYSGLVVSFGMVGAKLLHWADAVLTVLGLIYLGVRHFRSTNAGLLAGLIFIGTPQVAWSAATGSNDLPLAFFALLVVHCFLRWHEDQSRRGWLALAGFLGGYSTGVKPFGALTVGLLVGGVVVSLLWEKRVTGLRDALMSAALIGSTAFLACVPWMLHSYHLTGDPIFPALYRVFQTPYWNSFADTYARSIPAYYGADWSLKGLVTLPWQLTVNGAHYRTLIGPAFLASIPLVVIALLAARGRAGLAYRWLAVFAALWTLVWFASGLIVLRYTESIIAIAALLIAATLIGPPEVRTPSLPIRIFGLAFCAFALILNSQLLVPLQRHANEPLVEARAAFAWRYLYEGQSDREYLTGMPQIVWYLNDQLGASRAGIKVYDGCGLIPYYAHIKVELFNGWHYDGPTYIEGWNLMSPDALTRLKEAGVTHVVVCEDQESQLRGSSLWSHLRPVPLPSRMGHLLYVVDSEVGTP